MVSRLGRHRLQRLALSLLLAASCGAQAQAPGHEILDSVELHENAECAWIDVHFLVPTAYLSHFPATEGRQVRVDVQLLDRAEVLTERMRESLRLRAGGPLKLIWVNLEVGAFTRGALFVEFNAATSYKVGQGADGRSIVIAVPVKAGAPVCSADLLRTSK